MTSLSGPRWIIAGTRMYQTVHDICVLMDAILVAGQVALKTQPEEPHKGRFFTLASKQFPILVRIPISGPFYLAVLNDPRIPNYQVTFSPYQPEPIGPGYHRTVNLKSIQRAIFMTQLILFWERHSGWVWATYKRADDMPPILRFLWVMRGAAAHGNGAYNYGDKNRPPVTWHNLTYTAADAVAGRLVFEQDLMEADILILLFEASDELDGLGAPLGPPPKSPS